MTLLTIRPSSQFKKDIKKLKHNQKALLEIDQVIAMLAQEQPLPARYEDHPLTGEFKGFRDCHVRPDLVLIYKIDENILELYLLRVGSHSELDL